MTLNKRPMGLIASMSNIISMRQRLAKVQQIRALELKPCYVVEFKPVY